MSGESVEIGNAGKDRRVLRIDRRRILEGRKDCLRVSNFYRICRTLKVRTLVSRRRGNYAGVCGLCASVVAVSGEQASVCQECSGIVRAVFENRRILALGSFGLARVCESLGIQQASSPKRVNVVN